MNKINYSLLIFLIPLNSFAQYESPFDKYAKAEEAVEYEKYSQASEIYKQLYTEYPQFINLAYKTGFCYLKNKQHQDAIPYLETAVENISKEYDDDFDSRSAPSEALFYLAISYQLDYRIDEALEYFNRFKLILKPKREKTLIEKVDKKIQECQNALFFMANPKEIKVENLGDKINTPFPEYSPVLSADERTLIFTSRREGSTGDLKTSENQYFEDIYISHKINNEWTSPVQIKNIVSPGHEATISITADGQQLFVYKDIDGNGDIYTSTLINNNEWTELKKLDEGINSRNWETHASITPNGRTLYFVSDRKGGFGGRDIYKTINRKDGSWSPPINLGPQINTQYEEDGVFIHPDGKTLYFSSQGHKSMGGFDIFKSIFNEQEGSWSTPENMGYPINSTDDDIFFVLTPDGKRAYYASSNQQDNYGDQDIYLLHLISEHENCLTVLRGRILSDTDPLSTNTSITVSYKNGDIQGVYKPNLNTGYYILILQSDNSYDISFTIDDYESEYINLDVTKEECYREIEKEIDFPTIKVNKGKEDLTFSYLSKVINEKKEEKAPEIKFVLKNIFFDFNKATIDENKSKVELGLLYNFMSRNPTVTIEIHGHTDSIGSVKSNLKLSQNRANAVVNYIATKGIDKNRMIPIGYGETQPVESNSLPNGLDNPIGRALNRRVELKIIKY